MKSRVKVKYVSHFHTCNENQKISTNFIFIRLIYPLHPSAYYIKFQQISTLQKLNTMFNKVPSNLDNT